MAILNWNAGAVMNTTTDRVVRGMTRAVLYLEGQAKRLVSTPNPDGSDPSAPGEPPHRVSGNLRADISHEVSKDGQEVRGAIGVVKGSPADAYAMRLEFGYHGTDALGRNINQEARPFLRPTVLRNRNQILRLIAWGAIK